MSVVPIQNRVYVGHAIDASGRRPSPKLVSAIVNAPQPKNAKKTKSFIGLITYYSQFLPCLSIVLKPLHVVANAPSEFNWTPECEASFKQAKELLVKRGLLVHFNPALPIFLICDASPVRAGVCLAHKVQYQG